MFFIFNTQEVFSEQKRLTSLNLSGTDQGEPSTRPPSCTTPRQPKINGPWVNYFKVKHNFFKDWKTGNKVKVRKYLRLVNNKKMLRILRPGKVILRNSVKPAMLVNFNVLAPGEDEKIFQWGDNWTKWSVGDFEMWGKSTETRKNKFIYDLTKNKLRKTGFL